MNIWNADSIFLFIIFVVPGFIAMRVYDLLIPSDRGDTSKKVVDAISFSCITYAILFWPIYMVEQTGAEEVGLSLYASFYAAVLILAPVLLVVVWKCIREFKLVQNLAPHPTPKPWDYVFSKRQSCWMIVTLQDGKKIAGMFGPNSFASSAPAPEEIYLEEQWLINSDGGFERPYDQTSGVVILSDQIRTIELFHDGETRNE